MNTDDYILKEDVTKLTEDEFNNFRNYLRLTGFTVDGRYSDLSFARYKVCCLVMDTDGDLVWETAIPNGNQITLEEIRRMIKLSF